MVVVPSSLVANWQAEFGKWLRFFLSPHASSADRRVLVASASAVGSKAALSARLGLSKPAFKKARKAAAADAAAAAAAEEGPPSAAAKGRASVGPTGEGGVATAVRDFLAVAHAPVLVISYEG